MMNWIELHRVSYDELIFIACFCWKKMRIKSVKSIDTYEYIFSFNFNFTGFS